LKSSHVLILVSAVAVGGSAAAADAAKAPPKLSKQAQRGQYLVTVAGCNDCHTPLAMGPQGPAPDMTRMLSGHNSEMKMPNAPQPIGPWMVSMAATNTAFSGPWGTSYVANITSDKETGIGGWTEKQFIQTMKTGKHQGAGRPILPPMGWQNLAAATDDDLKSIFAYLQSTPPVKNKVPEPLPPSGPPPGGEAGAPAPAGGPAPAAPGKK
jgi:hypothetical protein